MQLIKIPSDRMYNAFEITYTRYNNAFGHTIINELLTEVRYGLFKRGYKINSMVTVYYVLVHLYDDEPDATRWNVYQPTDVIIERAESEIEKLHVSNKLVSLSA